MQVFVTGANGCIGGAVATALIAAGHKVRGLVRNKAKAREVARGVRLRGFTAQDHLRLERPPLRENAAGDCAWGG
jgi:uncharacterized protein YbjT (DUF2867 family)